MRTLVVVTCLCSALPFAAGCGNAGSFFGGNGSSSGGVAVVDLDKVAQRLGRNVYMTNSLNQKKETLTHQLSAWQADVKKKISDKSQEFGSTPTEEQKKQIKSLEFQTALELNKAKQAANVELTQHRQQLILNFREEVKPTIRQVAASNGLNIVIPKDDSLLLMVEPQADITEQVIAKLTTQSAPRDAVQTADPSRRSALSTGNKYQQRTNEKGALSGN